VADSKGGAVRATPLWLILYSKSRFFSFKRHIFRCAHLRETRTQLVNCLPPPPFQNFWIRHCTAAYIWQRVYTNLSLSLLVITVLIINNNSSSTDAMKIQRWPFDCLKNKHTLELQPSCLGCILKANARVTSNYEQDKTSLNHRQLSLVSSHSTCSKRKTQSFRKRQYSQQKIHDKRPTRRNASTNNANQYMWYIPKVSRNSLPESDFCRLHKAFPSTKMLTQPIKSNQN